MEPPNTVDGADVLYWAWSAPEPFFHMVDTDGQNAVAIHGLAVCRYRESGSVYRFSCDSNWETVNDSDFDSIESAKAARSIHYDIDTVTWRRR